MAVSQQQITLEEFLALPEQKPALEYFDGEVTQKVPPDDGAQSQCSTTSAPW